MNCLVCGGELAYGGGQWLHLDPIRVGCNGEPIKSGFLSLMPVEALRLPSAVTDA